MVKAFEVMSHELATCAPEDSISQAAQIMRDWDIGNILVVENGKLCGIVTDRDLVVKALASEEDLLESPIHNFMNAKVIFGQTNWSLKRVARTMAEHQIRRLPIVQNEKLAGIISLGDLSQYEDRNNVTANTLKSISEPTGISIPGQSRLGRTVIGVILVSVVATFIAWLNWNEKGQDLLNKITKSELYHTAMDGAIAVKGKLEQAASRKVA